MIEYSLASDPRADLDSEATFNWYERAQSGLGVDFLDELRTTYDRIAKGPLKHQEFRSGIRRALFRRFSYAVYFAVEGHSIIVLAVLHASRNPAEWQRRSS